MRSPVCHLRRIRHLVICDASVLIGHRSTCWAIGVCGRSIALDCGRIFSRFGWFCRLIVDYERSAETTEAMAYIASIYLMRNRIKWLFKQALNMSELQIMQVAIYSNNKSTVANYWHIRRGSLCLSIISSPISFGPLSSNITSRSSLCWCSSWAIKTYTPNNR